MEEGEIRSPNRSHPIPWRRDRPSSPSPPLPLESTIVLFGHTSQLPVLPDASPTTMICARMQTWLIQNIENAMAMQDLQISVHIRDLHVCSDGVRNKVCLDLDQVHVANIRPISVMSLVYYEPFGSTSRDILINTGGGGGYAMCFYYQSSHCLFIVLYIYVL